MNVKFRCISLFVLLLSTGVFAQHQNLGFYTAVKQDSVFLYLNKTPEPGQAFIVERKQGGGEYVRLTRTSVRAIYDGAHAVRVLGACYGPLQKALKVESEEQLLVKLRTDPYYGQVAMFMYRQAARVLGRLFIAGGNSPGSVYTFRITLTESDGTVIDSAERRVTVVEKKPNGVNGFTCAQKGEAILLSWKYPRWKGNMDDLAFQYMIFRKQGAGPFTRIHDIPLLRIEGFPLRYEDRNIIPGNTYAYRIVVVDVTGALSDARECIVHTEDVRAPARPGEIETHESGSSIIVSWNRHPEDDVTGYHVFRWAAGAKDSLRLTNKPLPCSSLSYRDSTADVGTSYFYAISAVDSAGNQSPCSNRIDALLTDKTPPGSPASFSARLKQGAVYVEWSPPGDPDVAGYKVRRGFTREHPFDLHAAVITSTCFTDSGTSDFPLKPGVSYFYSAAAIDTMGYEGEAAGAWVTIPDNEAPAVPGRVIAANNRGRGMTIKWNPSLAGDIAAYVVFRITDSDTAAFDTVESRILFSADRYVEKGKIYAYAVAGIDTAGNIGEKSFSHPVMCRDFDPPTSPAYVSALATQEGVKICWEPVGDFDLAGYKIFRGRLPTATGELCFFVTAGTHCWIHAQGIAGYWYWIRAVDTSGNMGASSPAAEVKNRP